MRLRRFPGALAIAVGLFSAIGCAPLATVRSVRDSTFHGQISRLAVVIGEGSVPSDAEQLSVALRKELGRRHIASLIVAASEDRSVDEVAIEKFHPDAVLTLAPKVVIQTAYGMRAKVRYDASVWLAQAPDKRIWRAEVEHSCVDTGTYCRESDIPWRLKAMASRLVENLEADGLLAPQARPVNQTEGEKR